MFITFKKFLKLLLILHCFRNLILVIPKTVCTNFTDPKTFVLPLPSGAFLLLSIKLNPRILAKQIFPPATHISSNYSVNLSA